MIAHVQINTSLRAFAAKKVHKDKIKSEAIINRCIGILQK